MKIVYTSNAGHTQRYAEMLATRLKMSVLPLDKAKKEWQDGEEILYFGWINGGRIEGLAKAMKKFKVAAVCAVGIGSPTATVNANLKAQNGFSCPCFYLQGGFDMQKLKGVCKMEMQIEHAELVKKQKNGHLTQEEASLLYIMENSVDFVSEIKLDIVVHWVESCRYYI